jgi:hypothetical protein
MMDALNGASSSLGLTRNPRASLRTTVRLGTLSPRSICPTYVAVRLAASARSSCVLLALPAQTANPFAENLRLARVAHDVDK